MEKPRTDAVIISKDITKYKQMKERLRAVNRQSRLIVHLQQYKLALFICMAVVGLLALSACAAQYPLNPKVDIIGRTDSDRSQRHIDRSDPLFLIIAFSGGGTRAASLAYGTLEALKRVDLPGTAVSSPGEIRPRTMLDEVSLITAVSGGSFTAAYYGLHGEGIFKDFRERFLTRDVQGDL